MNWWHTLRSRGQLSPLRLGSASFWLENLALPGCALALEAIVIGAWLQLGAAWIIGDAAQPLLASWVLFLVLLEAFWLARWLAAHHVPGKVAGLLIVLGWAISLALMWYLRVYASSSALWQPGWLETLLHDLQTDSGQIGAAIGLLFLSAFLWWRGLRLGRAHLEEDQIARSFKIGFAALILALLLIGTVPAATRGTLAIRLGLALPLFLFVGLSALSLAKLAEIRRRRRERMRAQADPTRSWIVVLLTLSGALVLVTLLIEQLFSFQLWLLVLTFLQPVWDAIAMVLGWIALGIAFVAYWIVHPLVEGVRALFGGGQQQSSQPPPGVHPPTLPQGGNTGGVPLEWVMAVRYALLALGLLLLLLLLWRSFRTFASWRHPKAGDEERESLGAMRAMRAQLRALLAALGARWKRAPALDEAESASDITVRLLYRQLLRQARTRGIQRAPAETPQEFAQRLRPALARSPAALPGLPASEASTSGDEQPSQPPPADRDLVALTAAYEQARYGEQEPASAQLIALTEQTEHLLRRLEQGQQSVSQHWGAHPPGR
jgi:hypothetical protein